MTATINGDWHLYSQDGGEGPFSTTFTFAKNPLINYEGKVKEIGKLKKSYEEAFKSDVRFYEKTVNFIQTIKLHGNVKTNVTGKVEFMVCNNSQCLPPSEVEFSLSIGG
jgi:thiol:disulfide interchange protein DsbD